eukprot:13589870-Ditylum_brightwellii.AAC.1
MGIQKTFPSDGDAEVMWLDLESIFGPDFYLAKTEWLKDNSAIVVQVLDRRQKNLALVMFDATTGARINLHLEQAMDEKSWVNLNDGFRVLEYSNNTDEEKIIRFLWASEQDGYRHLYVREANLAGPSSD